LRAVPHPAPTCPLHHFYRRNLRRQRPPLRRRFTGIRSTSNTVSPAARRSSTFHIELSFRGCPMLIDCLTYRREEAPAMSNDQNLWMVLGGVT
jgi:hypothetical protein